MNNKIEVINKGAGLPTIITVVFVILKLLGYISWSWWWVLSPLWISLGITVLLWIVALICGIVASLFNQMREGENTLSLFCARPRTTHAPGIYVFVHLAQKSNKIFVQNYYLLFSYNYAIIVLQSRGEKQKPRQTLLAIQQTL